jgi:hypothetical protein
MFLLLFPFLLQGQWFFVQFHGVVTDVYGGAPLTDVLVEVDLIDGSKHFGNVITKRNGEYQFELDRGYHYSVRYSKTGYVAKLLELDMTLIPDTPDVPFYDMDVQMVLFETIPDVDVSLFTSPVGRAEYKETVRTMSWENAYSDSMKVLMAKVMKEYTKTYRGYYARTNAKPPIVIANTPLVLKSDSNDVAVVHSALEAFVPPDTATSYYNDTTAAPATQVETLRGLFFSVQVGVYSKPTALDRLFNITPLNSELMEEGKIRYTSGTFSTVNDANAYRNKMIRMGVPDSFVIAYFNGKRVPIQDALFLANKFGKDILLVK